MGHPFSAIIFHLKPSPKLHECWGKVDPSRQLWCFFSRQIFTTVATLNLQPLQQLARQEVPESSEMLGFWVSCGCKNALFVVGYGFIVFGGLGCGSPTGCRLPQNGDFHDKRKDSWWVWPFQVQPVCGCFCKQLLIAMRWSWWKTIRHVTSTAVFFVNNIFHGEICRGFTTFCVPNLGIVPWIFRVQVSKGSSVLALAARCPAEPGTCSFGYKDSPPKGWKHPVGTWHTMLLCI